MSNWKWKLHRLLAMSPDEIAARAWRAARSRGISAGVLRPYPVDPAQCFQYAWREEATSVYRQLLQRFPCSCHTHETWREFLLREHPQQAQAIVSYAEDILQAKMRLFDFEVQTDVPPRWFRNYVQGGEWPARPARCIDYRRSDIAGGVRYCWELNRHGYFLPLALGWLLTGDRRFAERLLTDWQDWIAQNPVRFGINWTSVLECALRIHTWCWSLWLLKESDLLTEPALQLILGSLWQQTAEVAMNLSIGSSANNHLIGEAAGMWTFSCLFPTARHASRWMRKAHYLLSREIPRQISPDGVSREQAIHYQVFVMEMALQAESLARQAGATFGAEYARRMLACADFLQAISDCAGHVPHIGDSDDAEVLPFSPKEHHLEEAMVDTVRALYQEASPTTLKAAFFSAQPARGERKSISAIPSRLFAEGGYAVLRDETGECVAVMDCGALGWGSLAAHAHADALSLTLSIAGQPVLDDAGTYCYHDEPVWRDAFRSTRYHNTVCVDGEDQSEMRGPFLWGMRARTRLLLWHTSPLVDLVCASHDGYRRIGCGEHVRWFYWIKPNLWLVVDHVERSEGRRVEQCWCLSQQANLRVVCDDTLEIRCAETSLRMHLVSPVQVKHVYGAEAAVGGWISPSFGVKQPTVHLFLVRTPSAGRIATLLISGNATLQLRSWHDTTEGWELHMEYLGQEWLIGSAQTTRPWQIPGATIHAKGIVATWTAELPSPRYEVTD
ncbi:MAG: alginate lyase family protein [Armatimonadota bacterium]|nr:alginate lyase family protein [Armatimonadota bacterium]